MKKTTSRITSKGQVTIPNEIRFKYGFLPNTEVRWAIQKGQVFLIKEDKTPRKRGNELIRRMTSKQSLGMTTDEIMKLTRS
jgi:bifunctional DNA-binding transcriptional regulator/antitoxin component of YhaV-PrlF toxin-antitoxin module